MDARTIDRRSYPPAVRAAIHGLDEFDPGWLESIDTERINLASDVDCICGQRFGRYNLGIIELNRRGWKVTAALGTARQRTLGNGYRATEAFFPDRSGATHRAWVAEIMARREIARRAAIAELDDLAKMASTTKRSAGVTTQNVVSAK